MKGLYLKKWKKLIGDSGDLINIFSSLGLKKQLCGQSGCG